MRKHTFFAGALVMLTAASTASAFPTFLNEWQARYGGQSTAGDTAGCQLCHGNANGGAPWNGYGWDLLLGLEGDVCDLDNSGFTSLDEGFTCVEALDSDGDSNGTSNLDEIVEFSSQPGWRLGECNIIYSDAGVDTDNPAPAVGLLDPPGSKPIIECDDNGGGNTGGITNRAILVMPGESIQEAIDGAGPGSRIVIFPGVYQEDADPVNGLTITKSDLEIIGLNMGGKGVTLAPTGTQRNGIVIVPPDRTECMACHETMAPPFTLLPGIESGGESDPVIFEIKIEGITIDAFENNGLFTERLDSFKFKDVHSVNNRNYGIFPTLSSNGVIKDSTATGADDSGIWVETSTNVLVTGSMVEDNVNGFEVSNSDDITLENNIAVNNSVGFALLTLPELVDERPGTNRITVRNNFISNNNRINTATPGSVLAVVPKGIGILNLGIDNSTFENNEISDNGFSGIATADYCLSVLDTPFDCTVQPPPAEFDPTPENNVIIGNTLVNNGLDPGDDNPFAFGAADLTHFMLGTGGNCYSDNDFSVYFGLATMVSCEDSGARSPKRHLSKISP